MNNNVWLALYYSVSRTFDLFIDNEEFRHMSRENASFECSIFQIKVYNLYHRKPYNLVILNFKYVKKQTK